MTMATTESVRKTITVRAPQERAFEVFTAIDTWWSRDHHIGDEPLAAVVLEPRAGGRWYERGEAGGECNWGDVLEWDPPARIVLAWRISADWKYDPELLTEVEVRFVAESPTTTRVELEHRKLEAFGDRAGTLRGQLDSPGGWTGLLERFGAAI